MFRLVIELAPAFQASEATATRSCRYRRELGLLRCAMCSSPGVQLLRNGSAKASKMRISDSRYALRLTGQRRGERQRSTWVVREASMARAGGGTGRFPASLAW